MPKEKLVRKTYTNTEVITDAEAKKLFEAATKTYDCEIKGAVDEGRTMYLKISTSTPDRSNDVVNPKGVILDHYIANPIVSGFHEYGKPSVGRALQVGVADTYIVSKMEFPPEGINPDADILHGLYKSGFQKAASIGFIPRKKTQNDLGGYNFEEWELLEFALVLVPDNPEAVAMMYEKGFNPDTFEKDFGKETEEKEVTEITVKIGDTGEVVKTLKDADAAIKKVQAENEELKKQLEAKATEDTKVSELTAGQLKELFGSAEVEQKDVDQVIQLAYVLDVLSWYIYVFENNEVSQSSIDKLNQALGLVLQVVQEQAAMGSKSLSEMSLKDFPDTKEAVKILAKAGRTISSKHEEMLKAACDHMTQGMEQVQTVLNSVAADEDTADTGDDKTVGNSFAKRLAEQVARTQKQTAKADKEVGMTLRLLKQIKSKEGGDK